jgi:AcrR family transcriptional regulator
VARTIPADRFPQLIDAAVTIFVARGYRQTQMADVAEALGLGKGTLYGYVASKEALFDAAIRYADRHQELPGVALLPLKTPPAGSTVSYVRGRLMVEASELLLVKVVAQGKVIRGSEKELSAIISDLYQRMAHNRKVLKLIDRCAPEYPELAQVWFDEGRWAQHQLLVELIKRRMDKGHFRKVSQPEIVARTILESVAFWAMHRHFDPSPQTVSDADAEAALVDLVTHGLLQVRR